MTAPGVSVVVPVRDDGDGVRELLRCLAAQTVAPVEILVGDDGSADGSLDRLGHDGLDVRVLSGPPHTSYAARNRAAAGARAPVLAFCDADCRPRPEWLEEGLRALRDAEVAAGEIRLRAPQRPTVWTLLSADAFLDQARAVRRGRAATANLFVRREVFAASGGFDARLPSGGDYAWTQAVVATGGRLVHAPRAVGDHPTLDTAGALLRKMWWTNYWWGYRNGLTDRRRDVRAAVLALLPLVGPALSRRSALRPAFGLAAPRLAAAGLAPGRSQRWRALVAREVIELVPLVARTAGAEAARRARTPRRRSPARRARPPRR